MNRAEAAKINGAKSGGPKTPEGKAISSKNALHFGLNACDVVIPGEDPAEYEDLFNEIRQTYDLADLVELEIVSEMAAARWRLRRIPRMEQAAYHAALERARKHPDASHLTDHELSARAMNEFTNGPEMKQVHRHETRLRRIWEKSRQDLEALITDRHIAERRAKEQEAAAKYLESANAAWEAELAKIDADMEVMQQAFTKPSPRPSAPAVLKPQHTAVQNEPEARPETRAA